MLTRDQVWGLSRSELVELECVLCEKVPEEVWYAEFSLSDELIEELERRVAEHEHDPGSSISYEEFIARMEERYGPFDSNSTWEPGSGLDPTLLQTVKALSVDECLAGLDLIWARYEEEGDPPPGF